MRQFLVNRKRELIAGAIALALGGVGAALAQIANNFVLINPTLVGHFLNGGNQNPILAPVGGSCTIAVGSTDTDGACQASAASGTVTFASPYLTAPFCVVADSSATSTVSMPVYTISTTAITLSTIISGHTLVWHCASRQGG